MKKKVCLRYSHSKWEHRQISAHWTIISGWQLSMTLNNITGTASYWVYFRATDCGKGARGRTGYKKNFSIILENFKRWKKYLMIVWKVTKWLRFISNTKVPASLKADAISHPPCSPWWESELIPTLPPRDGMALRDTYLWDTVLRPLGHWVGHGQMVNHHDVLIGLIHCSGRLCTRTNGRTAVRDGGSRRLYLRPLEKLRRGGKKY